MGLNILLEPLWKQVWMVTSTLEMYATKQGNAIRLAFLTLWERMVLQELNGTCDGGVSYSTPINLNFSLSLSHLEVILNTSLLTRVNLPID